MRQRNPGLRLCWGAAACQNPAWHQCVCSRRRVLGFGSDRLNAFHVEVHAPPGPGNAALNLAPSPLRAPLMPTVLGRSFSFSRAFPHAGLPMPVMRRAPRLAAGSSMPIFMGGLRFSAQGFVRSPSGHPHPFKLWIFGEDRCTTGQRGVRISFLGSPWLLLIRP